MRRSVILAILSVLLLVSPARAEIGSRFRGGADAAGVVLEMNMARQHPDIYAHHLEELRDHFKGNVFISRDGAMERKREGVGAINEAIRFLRQARPLPPLIASPGMSMAAAEHVAEQASGALGHRGSDFSNPGDRLNRHGTWKELWGENIAYGRFTARDMVVALIVDDGLRGRTHRKNIFNSAFHYAGVAVGSHARYRTVCSIDFAGAYVETRASPGPLFVRN
jgi:hypothetical protein